MVDKTTLTAPEALAALMEGKNLRDKVGNLWTPDDLLEKAQLLLASLIYSAPFTIIDDPKHDELPEYLEKYKHWDDVGSLNYFLGDILHAVDERILAMEKNHVCIWHSKDARDAEINERIAKAIEGHEKKKQDKAAKELQDMISKSQGTWQDLNRKTTV